MAAQGPGCDYDREYVTIRRQAVRHSVAVREWRCSACESRLKTVWLDGGWRTVCAADAGHPADRFVHVGMLERQVHVEMLQAGNLELAERRLKMGLKDRDTLFGVPKRLRLGRIGRVRQGIMATSSKGKQYPKAVEYFILDPLVEDGGERARILEDVRAAVERYAPGQDLERPTVLPILFLAQDDELIAPESYKLRRGKGGTVWCAGDGEVVRWKMSDDFQVEVAEGARLDTGEVVACPGAGEQGRQPWCEGCGAELEINFAVLGYERTGMWMLRTSSMTFRDQFWTQIGMVRAMAERGLIAGLVGVPFLLRRKLETVLSPVGSNGSLANVEMPITTIEIHPEWFRQVMRRNPRLLAGVAGEPKALSEPCACPAEPEAQDRPPAGPAVASSAEPSGAGQEDGPPAASPPVAQVPGSAGTGGQAGAQPQKNGRPVPAARVRSVVRFKAGWVKGSAGDYADAHRAEGEPLTEVQLGTVAGLLGQATRQKGMTQADLDKDRHQLLSWLFRVDSTRKLTKREAGVLIDWLSAGDGKAGELNPYGRAEAAACLQAIVVEQGQLPLPAAAEMDVPLDGGGSFLDYLDELDREGPC